MTRQVFILGLLMAVPFFATGCLKGPSTLTGPDPADDGVESEISYSRLPSYWRGQVVKEICYALSKQRYLAGDWGASTRISSDGRWFLGDWNYANLGRGVGGSCKQFARTIVRRATGNRYDLPSGYRYANGDIAWCRPGDVIQRSDIYGTPHTAIVFKILERDGAGRAVKIDVIDSNFIQSNTIARHVLPSGSYKLNQFRVW